MKTWVCTQRQCEINKDIVELQNHVWIQNFRKNNQKITMLGKSEYFFVVLWLGRWNDVVSWQTRRLCNLQKASTPCIDDHHCNEKELKPVGALSKVCSQIVLKCWYLARIGPDILWSVNKLARSITKWTKTCAKRLSRLISYIHRTCVYTQYCHVGHTAKQCNFWDWFETPILQEILRTQNLLLEEHCAFWESYICSNKLDVSHSSTESEIISFGRWIEIRRVIVAIHHGNTYQSNQGRRTNVKFIHPPHTIHKRKQSQRLQTSILLVRKLRCMC